MNLNKLRNTAPGKPISAGELTSIVCCLIKMIEDAGGGGGGADTFLNSITTAPVGGANPGTTLTFVNNNAVPMTTVFLPELKKLVSMPVDKHEQTLEGVKVVNIPLVNPTGITGAISVDLSSIIVSLGGIEKPTTDYVISGPTSAPVITFGAGVYTGTAGNPITVDINYQVFVCTTDLNDCP